MYSDIKLTAACVSDVGQKRKVNEDSYCVDADFGLYLVADGMGGHGSGDIASSTASRSMLDALKSQIESSDSESEHESQNSDSGDDNDYTVQEQPNPIVGMISTAVKQANETVFALNKERGNPDGYGMGTTLVGFWRIQGLSQSILFQVGDSRLYIYRKDRLLQLTRDHTAYQEWERNGRTGFEPSQNLILRAVGLFPEVNADVRIQSLRAGDRFLICSDGLTSMVQDKSIEQVFSGGGNDQELCQKLVDMANEAGGDDNITVLIVTVS